MIEFIAINMAPIMFASLVFFLLLGYPVAFSLAANGLVFFAIGVWMAPWSSGTITLDWPLLFTMPQRLWGVLSNETLLAIPFFTLMGLILERSGEQHHVPLARKRDVARAVLDQAIVALHRAGRPDEENQ